MKSKLIIVLALGLLLCTSIGLTTVSAADPWPSLPSSTVQLSVLDDGNSYFDATLSGVPAGYSVNNGPYDCWCVDRDETMQRSTNHNVILYSSMNPPAALNSINWNAINYILNHKQGTMMDVQNAIWYFTDGTSVSGAALAMVNAAEANLGYNPVTMGGTVLAIICYDSIDDNNVQNTIIELRKPCLPGLSPGFWKHNVGVFLGIAKGSFSDPGPNLEGVTKTSMENFLGQWSDAELTARYNDLNTKGGGAAGADTRVNAANVFNNALGLANYMG